MRILASAVGVVLVLSGTGQSADSRDAVEHPAVPAIVQAFSDHPLVAIGEAHRNQQVHDLIVRLLVDRAFLPEGGDVVVEWGNSRYQTLIDRYVAGEPIPRERLVHV